MAAAAGAAPAVSFAAAAQKEGAKAPLTVVQLEGLVVLKIAKHCREHAAPGGAVVTGQLLGLDVGGTLEVTDAFPFPGADDDGGAPAGAAGGATAPGGEDYQLEMMRCLRETNADANMVGWYQSAEGGSHAVVEVVETFVSYADNLGRCVCVVYDASAPATGSLGLRAVRLADGFAAAFRGGALTIERVRALGLSWRDAFEEVPIRVRNSPLAAALAAQLAPRAPLSAGDADRLGLGGAAVVERSLGFLGDCVDDLVGEQGRLSAYAAALRRHQQAVAQWRLARRHENTARRAAGEEPLPEEPPEGEFRAPPEPGQLDSMLLLAQMDGYADQVGGAAARAIQKLALLEGLHAAAAV